MPWRFVRRYRDLSLMAILTVALAVGANTAVFSVVRAVFLRPLGFPEEARLVEIRDCNPAEYQRVSREGKNIFDQRGCTVTSGVLYRDLLVQAKNYETLGAMNLFPEQVPLGGASDQALVRGWRVTPSFFKALGVPPVLGRWFEGQDEVVLSYGLWQERFGAGPNIVGRKILLRDTPQRVAGVMPPDFHYPPGARIWLPHPYGTREYFVGYGARNLNLVGRLRRGVSTAAAQAEATAFSARAAGLDPHANQGWSTQVDGLLDEMTFEHRRGFAILSAAVGIVLLIGCANLSACCWRGSSVVGRRCRFGWHWEHGGAICSDRFLAKPWPYRWPAARWGCCSRCGASTCCAR